jgi:hypothetical protein
MSHDFENELLTDQFIIHFENLNTLFKMKIVFADCITYDNLKPDSVIF